MICYQDGEFTFPLENVKAVLFDLFDTLILIGDNHECFTNSLIKLHSSLSKNGFLCDFSDFESSYVKVVEQIEAATAINLRDPISKYTSPTHYRILAIRFLQMTRPLMRGFAIFAANTNILLNLFLDK